MQLFLLSLGDKWFVVIDEAHIEIFMDPESRTYEGNPNYLRIQFYQYHGRNELFTVYFRIGRKIRNYTENIPSKTHLVP